MTTKYRDMTILFTFVVQISGCMPRLLSTRLVPSPMRGEYALRGMINPITSIVETFKYGALGVGTFSWTMLGYSSGFMVVLLTIGIVVFNKVQRSFMDTV